MKKRVLIISTSAGTGHVRAGQALEQAFKADERTGEVIHEDALKYTNKLFRDFYSKLYIQLVREAPAVLGWVYRTTDEPWKGEAVRVQLDRLNLAPMVKFIQDFDPQITICTHFLPSGLISHLIERGDLNTHHSIVVTDLDCHAMWLSRTFHRYFVAMEETKVHLEALGIPSERITPSGIPIDPIFAAPIDRAAALDAYQLKPDRPTLLLSAGALGVGPTEIIVRRLMELHHDTQTIVICGRSDELRDRILGIVGKRNPRFRVLGYSDRMHELMRVSDLFVGKPGGLTTSEALACGLPMCIVSPIPGQEERNSDHLLEKGCAIKANELTTLAWKIDQLLDDAPRLARMRENASRLGHPHAARQIVDVLLNDDLPPLVLDKEQRKAMAEAAAREV